MNDPFTEAALALVRAEVERLYEERVRPIEERLARLEAERDGWLTTEEAARHLGISATALRARARRRSVPAYRHDGRWLFDRRALDAVIYQSTGRPVGQTTATMPEVIANRGGERRVNGPAPGTERIGFDA